MSKMNLTEKASEESKKNLPHEAEHGLTNFSKSDSEFALVYPDTMNQCAFIGSSVIILETAGMVQAEMEVS